jgi:hypothetical protein
MRLNGKPLELFPEEDDSGLGIMDVFCIAALVLCIGVLVGFCWRHIQAGGGI